MAKCTNGIFVGFDSAGLSTYYIVVPKIPKYLSAQHAPCLDRFGLVPGLFLNFVREHPVCRREGRRYLGTVAINCAASERVRE